MGFVTASLIAAASYKYVVMRFFDGINTVCLLQPTKDVPVGTRFDCGMGTETSEIDYKKHFSAVTMKVTSKKDGIEGADAIDGAFAAVYDNDKAIPLSDGKGTFAVVERKLIDGAGVR